MQRTIWIAAFVLITIVCVGFWAAAAWRDRLLTVEEVAREAAVTARLLEEHAGRALEAGEHVLSLMEEMTRPMMAGGAPDPEGARSVFNRLRATIDTSPQIGSAWVLDADGRSVLDTWTYPPRPGIYTHREYFVTHRNGRTGTFVGPAAVGSVAENTRFTLSRRLRTPDGAFAGVAVVGIYARYFENFYREAGLGKGAAVHLVKETGELLSGWPVGEALDAEVLAIVHGGAPQKTAGTATIGDSSTGRILAYRRLPNHPVVVVAVTPLDTALAGWQERTLRSGLLAGTALAGFGLLMVMGLRSANRERAALVNLQQTRDDLERRVSERTTELARREYDLQLIADNLPALVSYVDSEERYRFVNKTYAEWFGRPATAFVGLSVREVLGEAAYDKIAHHIRAALAGRWVTYETLLPYKDGGARHVEAQYIPHSDAEGRRAGFYAFVTDISERRAAEQAVRTNEARYRALTEAFAAVIWTAGPNGAMRDMPRWQELTGQSRAEFRGHGWLESVHPDDRAHVQRTWERAVLTRTVWDIECRIRRRNGDCSWFSLRGVPVRDEGGSLREWVGVCVDINARKRMEDALRASEERYRHLFESMDQGFGLCGIICDDDGRPVDYRFLEVNPAFGRLTGLPPEVVNGRTVRELLPSLEDQVIENYGRAALNGETVRFENYSAALGRWFETSAFGIGNGRFAHFFLDITERKQAEERQALLMAELDHRVRNILASIQSMVSLTGRSAKTKEAYAKALQGRVSAMAHTHGLLTRHQWQGASLGQIVRDELKPYDGHNGSVTVDGPVDCILKPKDALNFALVIHELATNAAKYGALSAPGGRVTVRWRLEGDGPRAHLRVTWQESGGPAVEPPERRGFGSTLIESALGGDGETTVSLEFPPDGVRCVMDLPLRRLVLNPEEAAQSRPESVRDTPVLTRSLRNVRVLVVEDELLVGLQVRQTLLEAGMEVFGPMTSLREGLKAAARTKVDVAVLDVNLNGDMVVPLADMLSKRQVPFVLTTGYDVRTLLPKRFHTIPTLQKPVEPGALLDCLRYLTAPDALPERPPPLTEDPGHDSLEA